MKTVNIIPHVSEQQSVWLNGIEEAIWLITVLLLNLLVSCLHPWITVLFPSTGSCLLMFDVIIEWGRGCWHDPHLWNTCLSACVSLSRLCFLTSLPRTMTRLRSPKEMAKPSSTETTNKIQPVYSDSARHHLHSDYKIKQLDSCNYFLLLFFNIVKLKMKTDASLLLWSDLQCKPCLKNKWCPSQVSLFLSYWGCLSPVGRSPSPGRPGQVQLGVSLNQPW